jgi:DNA-directed RNA polymerase specialized sigma24 family protein
MAYRLYSRLSPQSRILKAIEMDDLEQEAYTRMLALFPKALTQKEPFRWLTGTAYRAMHDCVNGRSDTVKRHPSEKPIPILRLDQPLTDDGATLADLLPDTFRSPLLPEHVKNAIHQAITTLPEKQRTIILHHFGFFGAPASLRQIGRDAHPNSVRPHSTYQYKKALMTLQQVLSETFPVSQHAKVAAGGTRS